ncbi:hypothetical protein [Amycolatopsis sp. H20-H5]|uniref:hypothetical protein n=1 Tax=Amycolatopsis sp. H20-H5 TaxID=3046309 RepID=UPI002DC03292|nr:hypothetical protein [Amycolatopsis sp. H20-H5]MEC3974645.1 hypothetical protein [Amycolatopsis sp. H20-H5]
MPQQRPPHSGPFPQRRPPQPGSTPAPPGGPQWQGGPGNVPQPPDQRRPGPPPPGGLPPRAPQVPLPGGPQAHRGPGGHPSQRPPQPPGPAQHPGNRPPAPPGRPPHASEPRFGGPARLPMSPQVPRPRPAPSPAPVSTKDDFGRKLNDRPEQPRRFDEDYLFDPSHRAEYESGTHDEIRREALERRDGEPALKTMSDDGATAIHRYALGEHAHEVNEASRAGEGHHGFARAHAGTRVIVSGLNELPDHVGDVVRWIDFHGEPRPAELAAGHYEPGEIVVEPTLTSASITPPKVGKDVEIHLRAKTGKDISPFAAHPGERESLSRPGVQLLVESRELVVDPESRRGRWVIRAEEIAPDDARHLPPDEVKRRMAERRARFAAEWPEFEEHVRQHRLAKLAGPVTAAESSSVSEFVDAVKHLNAAPAAPRPATPKRDTGYAVRPSRIGPDGRPVPSVSPRATPEYFKHHAQTYRVDTAPDGSRTGHLLNLETGRFDEDSTLLQDITPVDEQRFVLETELARERCLSGGGPIFALYETVRGLREQAEGRPLGPQERALINALHKRTFTMWAAEFASQDAGNAPSFVFTAAEDPTPEGEHR